MFSFLLPFCTVVIFYSCQAHIIQEESFLENRRAFQHAVNPFGYNLYRIIPITPFFGHIPFAVVDDRAFGIRQKYPGSGSTGLKMTERGEPLRTIGTSSVTENVNERTESTTQAAMESSPPEESVEPIMQASEPSANDAEATK